MSADPGRPVVLVTNRLLEPAPSLLAASCEVRTMPEGGPRTGEAIAAAAAGCVGILSQVTDTIDARVLSIPGLRVVANCAVGYNNVDVAAATAHGVIVTNTPGVLDETTADAAFGLIIAAGRRFGEAERLLRSGGFDRWRIDMMLGQDIHGATLGIVGLGRIGTAVARRARGFGMRLLYTATRRVAADLEAELGAEFRSLDQLLAESDFVSLHTPLTAATHHLIGERELASMKPTAVLVNTSRGAVVDEAALARALQSGTIFAAGIDVYEQEPAVHPELLRCENAVLLPHIGSASVRTRSRMCEVAARNLLAVLAGQRPPNPVNPEVLD